MMLLDCNGCPGRGDACGGCLVATVLDPRPHMPVDLVAAIDVLQDAGLIGPVHLALVSDPPTERRRPQVVALRRRAG